MTQSRDAGKRANEVSDAASSKPIPGRRNPAIASASRLRVVFSKCPYVRSSRPATLREIIES